MSNINVDGIDTSKWESIWVAKYCSFYGRDDRRRAIDLFIEQKYPKHHALLVDSLRFFTVGGKLYEIRYKPVSIHGRPHQTGEWHIYRMVPNE